MAIEPTPEFDLGPLSWVQSEIDQALTRGLEALATFAANPADSTSLKHARSHVHQAAGAIQMVGLDAVVAYTDELERQLTRLDNLSHAEVSEACAVIDRACRKLKIFLDELVGGSPPVPLKLYPEYKAMQATRGIKDAPPTDLFYPDLAPRAPRIASQVLPPNKLPAYLVTQRRLYQRGLLLLLRGEEGGAAAMRDAIIAIEEVTTQGGLRAFWWTVGALFDALAKNGIDNSLGVKQLTARVDLQIRRVAEGSAKVADRLRREVLYFVAIAAPVAPLVVAVQRAFKLPGLIPSADSLSADVVRLHPLLREAREQLAGAKDAWLKAASGRVENLPKLKLTLSSVHAKAVEIRNNALTKLTATLVERLEGVPATGVPDALAMEFATALLLAESAFENYTSLSAEFPGQVDAMIARLDAARAGRSSAGSGAPMLDEMSKRAQERVLLAQVAREIQVNLRHIEQVLDAFFRDHAKRGELVALAKDSAQIRGALRMLGLNDANRLLEMCERQIESYVDFDTPVSDDDLELLAESLSGLGFYIEAVEQQRVDCDRLIAPLIAKRLGEAPAPAPVEVDSVEDAVAESRAALPHMLDEFHREPHDGAARDDLLQKLTGLRDDAELLGDAALVAQAGAVLKDIQTGHTDNLAAAVEAMAATSEPTPEISEETQRLLAIDATELDGELLEIYLLEAVEVLDTIAENLRVLTDTPGEREAVRTVRRGFHTLKGSGRMVGLNELGEYAYDVEKVMNRLVEDDLAASPAILNLIDVAERDFRGWVSALTSQGRVTTDPRALHAAIAAVERGLSGASAPEELASPVQATNVIPLSRTPITIPDMASPPLIEEIAATFEPEWPSLDLMDLPELGFGESDGVDIIAIEEPVDEIVQLVDVSVFDEAPPADPAPSQPAPLLTLVYVAPPGAATAIAPASIDPPSLAADPTEDDDIRIGDVTLARSLWTILCDEAEQHLATLENEQAVLQFDPRAVPTAAMVRASHTLCGIHRTGGFPLVATTARALEQTLIALEQRGAPLPSSAEPILARAIAGLTLFVSRVRSCEAFAGPDFEEGVAIQRELDELRQDASVETTYPDDDAEAEAAAVAWMDEEPVAEEVATTAEAPEDDPISEFLIPAIEEPVVEEPVAAVEPPVPFAVIHAAKPIASSSFAPVATVPAGDFVLPAKTVDPLAGIRDDVDLQVLPIFLDEAAELFPEAGEELRAWRRNPRDDQPVAQLRRTLHTFKGGARMAGAMRLGELAHLMESRLEGEAAAHPLPELFDALDEDLDDIAFVLDGLRRNEFDLRLAWVAAPESDAIAELVATQVPEIVVPPTAQRAVVVPLAQPSASILPVVPVPVPVAAAPQVRAAAVPEFEMGSRALLRVRADIIDRLVNEAGEVAIARSRIEGELRSLKANLLELTGSVIRLRTQMREIEIQSESQIQSKMSLLQEEESHFDPLEFDRYTRFQELTRSLAEGINDVSTVQQSLLKNLDDADAALIAQARLSREVQQKLFSIRTVPFGSLSERLYRILRTTAKELDKRANLEIHGSTVELDRSVLEKLVGPLEHLLRNALDHGIESREARRASGKSETGEIELTVRQVGNEVVIEIGDDGAGIDYSRVRRRADSMGIFATDATPTDAQLIECLFKPGFSTASKVTQISGRGIGMDVVRSEIAALGGRVEVTSTPGAGTRFALTMPLTLAVAQAVLIRAGGRLWALPAPMVEQVQQVKSQALHDIYVQGKVEWQGKTYPFHYLPRLLGDAVHNPETKRYNSVLLLRSGQSRAAIHVDDMVGNQEVVVKNIGPQLARVSGVSGATVLGTGEIVLIINPVQLVGRDDLPRPDPDTDGRTAGGAMAAVAAPVQTQPVVMIVDDSLTVRKITSRFLIREGFAVLTAKDGVDALQRLAEQVPDVILLDIEMPRMDGFEFTRSIKREARFAKIPIIMITSRTAEKHRNLAAELGVEIYLGKPYQEEELLRSIRSLTTPAAVV